MSRLQQRNAAPGGLRSNILTDAGESEVAVKNAAPVCRGCAGGELETILDLGRMPLANALLTEERLREPEAKYPLVFVFCPECSLAQITVNVPPETLFRQYLYFSSFSDTILHESRRIAERMVHSRRLDRNSRVVEIASNDGYLLQFYKQSGVPVLGVEPALNIAAAALDRGIPTVCEFFSSDLAWRLADQGQRADVIHANNVLAHVADLDEFLTGIATLLKSDGIVVIEVPYVRDMIEHVEFDTIYHEHLSYFSLTALSRLLESHALMITDVERLAAQGGSLRVFVEHRAIRSHVSTSVQQMLAEENRLGLTSFHFHEDFAKNVARLKVSLLACLRNIKSQGQRIAAYGASAKGSTLLNHFGIDGAILDFVVDRSTAKQGLYTPGTHLPVYAPEKLLEAMPGYVLLLTWNLEEEILEQQKEYRRRGGRFIVPIPEPRVI